MLPDDDPRRTSAVLQRAVAATEAEDLAAATASLRSVIEDEDDLLTQARSHLATTFRLQLSLALLLQGVCRAPCPLLLQTISS